MALRDELLKRNGKYEMMQNETTIPNAKPAFGIVLSKTNWASYFTKTFFTSSPAFTK